MKGVMFVLIYLWMKCDGTYCLAVHMLVFARQSLTNWNIVNFNELPSCKKVISSKWRSVNYNYISHRHETSIFFSVKGHGKGDLESITHMWHKNHFDNIYSVQVFNMTLSPNHPGIQNKGQLKRKETILEHCYETNCSCISLYPWGINSSLTLEWIPETIHNGKPYPPVPQYLPLCSLCLALPKQKGIWPLTITGSRHLTLMLTLMFTLPSSLPTCLSVETRVISNCKKLHVCFFC